MSTNAVVAISNNQTDLEMTGIYVHWDGGQPLADDLNKYHNSWELARELVSKGDLSYVSEDTAHSYEEMGDDWSTVKPETMDLAAMLEFYQTAEYYHIFHDSQWTFLYRDEVRQIVLEAANEQDV